MHDNILKWVLVGLCVATITILVIFMVFARLDPAGTIEFR